MERQDTPTVRAGFPVHDRLSYLWLLLAAALLLFANGLRIAPVAAWLAPVFMVRYLRTQRALPGLVIGYLAGAAAFYFQWSAAFADAGAMFGLYTAVFGLLAFLPYVADRLLWPRLAGARRLGGLASTLVLPAAWVTVEYVNHLVLPLGTFFSLAYTQSASLPLVQIGSLAGPWAITFLVAWLAGVANYAWERGFDVRRAGRAAGAYAAIVLAVLLFGGLRLALAAPAGETVQVAVLTTNVDREVLPEPGAPLDARLIAGALTADDRSALAAAMAEINDDLFARTSRVARAGARIVTWTEYNAHTFADEEQVLLDRARALARAEGIYLAFPLLVVQPEPARRPAPALVWTNKSVMVTPAGEIAYEYVKHNLLIGPESEHAVRGPRRIHTVDTPYGRLASVICLDMEYPDFMRLAGRQGVDIVLSGAIDGTPSSNGNPLHSIMASYRAVEEGFSLARGGSYGQNAIVDYQGRFLATANHVTAGDRTVVAHVPVKGVRTVYARIGDVAAWAALGLLAVLVVAALMQGAARRD